MQLFYPVSLEEGIHILRVKLRLDKVLRRDHNKNLTCYTTREAALRKALERRASGQSRQELFYIVIDVTVPGIVADLKQERPVDRKPLATFKGESREAVLLSLVAQDMLSKEGEFSLKVLPGTEDLYAETYPLLAQGNRPAFGPWK